MTKILLASTLSTVKTPFTAITPFVEQATSTNVCLILILYIVPNQNSGLYLMKTMKSKKICG